MLELQHAPLRQWSCIYVAARSPPFTVDTSCWNQGKAMRLLHRPRFPPPGGLPMGLG